MSNGKWKPSKSEFQGYLKATLETMQEDVRHIKNHMPVCDKRFDKLEQEQSKLKGIYMGAAGVLGVIGGFIGRLFK